MYVDQIFFSPTKIIKSSLPYREFNHLVAPYALQKHLFKINDPYKFLRKNGPRNKFTFSGVSISMFFFRFFLLCFEGRCMLSFIVK